MKKYLTKILQNEYKLLFKALNSSTKSSFRIDSLNLTLNNNTPLGGKNEKLCEAFLSKFETFSEENLENLNKTDIRKKCYNLINQSLLLASTKVKHGFSPSLKVQNPEAFY